MAEPASPAVFFEHLEPWRVLVCRRCRYAVWPLHIATHLKKMHRVAAGRAREIQAACRNRDDVVQDPGDWTAVQQLDRPLPALELHRNGLQCQIDPAHCRYVCLTRKAMESHVYTQHRGANGPRGRRSKDRDPAPPKWSSGVPAQRFFVQLHGSNFFRISAPEERALPDEDSVAREVRLARDRKVQLAEKRFQTIDEREPGTEYAPWLERVGWPKYLESVARQDLLKLVATPIEEDEPLVALVWQAMSDMIKHCQWTSINKTSYFVRMEIVRTEARQTKYQPLQPYMDRDSIVRHARPWQQIVAFFVRTRGRAREKPRYKLSPRQKTAFQAMMRKARGLRRRAVDGQDGHDRSDSDTSGGSWDSHATTEPDADGAEPPVLLYGLKRRCLQFCIALLAQTTQSREYRLPLICAMAVLGVKEEGWYTPQDYPPIMSRIIKMARFMVIQRGLQTARTDDSDEDSATDSETDSEAHGLGILDWTKNFVDAYMIRGSRAPMQWILDTRAYGLKIWYNTTGEGSIDWVGDQIRLRSIEFTMDQLRGMVHGLVAETRELLVVEIMQMDEADVPTIPWAQLRDDPTRASVGHNFVRDERNPWPIDDDHWLLERLIRSGAMRKGTVVRHPERVAAWMQLVVRFRELLLVLIHMTGGQPARGTEILGIRHSSSGIGEGRNVFVEDSTVVTVTRYHKGYQLRGDVKIIHRYLPRAVGALVVYYMWLVLPVQEVWESLEKGDAYRSSFKMWPTDPDGRTWHTPRMSRAMARISEARMGVRIGVAIWRDVAIAVSRKYLRTRFKNEEDSEEEEEEDNVEDLQAAHSTHVAGMVYARGIVEQAGVVASQRERYRTASEAWHRFLGFEVRERAGQKRSRAPYEDEALAGRAKRLKQLREVDWTAALRAMMGPEAQFREPQLAIIEAIGRGAQRILGVMPTGGGKSLTFMLPAWASGGGGVTVVVVPLVALRSDMARRCHGLGLECRQWSSRRPPEEARIVLVTPEAALGDSFTTFLNRLRSQQRLDRIVIDECHVALNEQRDFRPKLRELGRLNTAQVQMVMLTATMPPTDEDRWLQRMWLSRDDIAIVRAGTSRGNIAYRQLDVSGLRTGEQEARVLAMMQRRQDGLAGADKMVVYCASVADCRYWADQLDCEAFYHDADDKQGIMERFAGPEQKVVAATSAFGMGIDVPHIRAIIHVSMPRSMLEYAQESGRAGRDGGRSVSVIVNGRMKGSGAAKSEAKRAREMVAAFMQADCQRAWLDEYLDGRTDRTRCEEGEAACWGCGDGAGSDDAGPDVLSEQDEERSDQETEQSDQEREEWPDQERDEWPEQENEDWPGQEREERPEQDTETATMMQLVTSRNREIVQAHKTRVQQEREGMEQLRQDLETLAGRCPYCVFGSRGQSSQHPMYFCPEDHQRQIRQRYQELRNAVRRGKRLAAYGGCVRCFAPFAWCQRWKEREKEGEEGLYDEQKEARCQLEDVVIGVLTVAMETIEGYQPGLMARVEKAGMGNDLEGLAEYMGQRVEWGGSSTYRLIHEIWEAKLVEGVGRRLSVG